MGHLQGIRFTVFKGAEEVAKLVDQADLYWIFVFEVIGAGFQSKLVVVLALLQRVLEGLFEVCFIFGLRRELIEV